MSEVLIDQEYHVFPYGIYLPSGNKELIEKLKRFLIIREENPRQLWFNNHRVRTPRDSGSHPCYNCGHCIDNGHSSCSNKKCVKDRKERGLCDSQSFIGMGFNWIHNTTKLKPYFFRKKGLLYREVFCDYCHKKIINLEDYQQDAHCLEYTSYLQSILQLPIHSIDNCNMEIFRKTKHKKIYLHSQKSIITTRTAQGELRHLCLKRDNYKCRDCGATKEETTLEIDHIIPYSKGGKTELNNLQTLCKKCNRSKHTRIWEGGQ